MKVLLSNYPIFICAINNIHKYLHSKKQSQFQLNIDQEEKKNKTKTILPTYRQKRYRKGLNESIHFLSLKI